MYKSHSSNGRVLVESHEDPWSLLTYLLHAKKNLLLPHGPTWIERAWNYGRDKNERRMHAHSLE